MNSSRKRRSESNRNERKVGDSKSRKSDSEPTGLQFVELVDDCIGEIFRLLSMDDLCAVSRTCKRLNQLAGKDYQRRYPDKEMDISDKTLRSFEKNGKVLSHEKNHEKCFLRFIRNIHIKTSSQIDTFTVYMQHHINHCPKEIEFVKCEINAPLANAIKPALENLENVSFAKCTGDVEEVLKHCKNFKYLEIDGKDQQLPLNVYPKLEFVHFHINGPQIIEKLDAFFKVNQKIKQFICTFANQLPESIIIRCVEVATANFEQFEDLYFEFKSSKSFDFALINKNLNILREGKRLKQLELEKSGKMENVDLAMFTGLYGNTKAVSGSTATFDKLRNLEMSYCDFNEKKAADLAERLPNLEALYLQQAVHLDLNRAVEKITPLVQHAKKLKCIGIQDVIFIEMNDDDLKKNGNFLNEERTKLEGACKLTVCVSDIGLSASSEDQYTPEDWHKYKSKWIELKIDDKLESLQ